MLKNTTYKEKFVLLRDWMPGILASIKNDIKKDHLLQDWAFAKKYFPGKNVQKVTPQELFDGYSQAVEQEEKAEDIAEFIFNRWLVKHTEIYYYFEEELGKISKDFTKLEELDAKTSQALMNDSINKHGAELTYLFSVMNSVVFPQNIYDHLKQLAAKEAREQQEKKALEQQKQQAALTQKEYQESIAKLTDKYEKKLLGLQKKYHQDTEALKKQIAALQRKIQH